jgi:hypothetical protein
MYKDGKKLLQYLFQQFHNTYFAIVQFLENILWNSSFQLPIVNILKIKFENRCAFKF